MHSGPLPPATDFTKHDKRNRYITWLKDACATGPDSLPPPAEGAAEIVDSMELALARFRSIAARLAARP
jgi:type I restriction enzyme M protein